MNRFLILFIILWSTCFSAYSQASGLADLKFGQAQIADSQWNVQSCTQTATCQIYSKNPGTVYKIPWTNGQLTWAAGEYVAFVATGDNANPFNAIQYTANGTQKTVLGTGHIINMGANYFFFVGNDNNTGQLFSMTQGFANTSGVTWTGTLNPTIAQINQYATGGSTSPLSAGQTVAAPPPAGTKTVTYTNFLTFQTWDVEHYNSSGWAGTTGGSITSGWTWSCTNCGSTTSGTVDRVTRSSDDTVIFVYILDANGNMVISEPNGVYTYSGVPIGPSYPSYVTIGSGTAGTMVFGTSADITTPQQTKVTAWSNKTIADGNKIYIDQVGDNNLLTVLQEGNKNLIKGIGVDLAKIDGDGNNITIRQGVTGLGQNEINFSVIGDTNTLNINQARNTQGTAIGGNGHYQSVDINGYSNTLSTQQSNAGGVGGHYMETTINGNSNNVVSKQTENGNKIMFTTVSGNSNTIDARQKDAGQHYLDIKMTGNNNNATVLQEGTTANRATLDLTNAGGPANVTVQQNGGQSVSVTTTCATAGGCAPITVRQGY